MYKPLELSMMLVRLSATETRVFEERPHQLHRSCKNSEVVNSTQLHLLLLLAWQVARRQLAPFAPEAKVVQEASTGQSH